MSKSDLMRFKATIKAIAAQENIPAQVVLQNYALERLLARISKAPLKDHLVIKGGYLISSLLGLGKRTTMDLDATIRNTPLTEDNLKEMLNTAFSIDLNDGFRFTIKSISAIRDDDIYGGFRVKFDATRESLLIALSADFSTGDIVTPEPKEYFLKSRFIENLSFRIWGYTIETILAEKVQTILSRGVLNTRPRDFYDVAILSGTFHSEATLFATALRATCEHRHTTNILSNPLDTLDKIYSDQGMTIQWEKYRKQYSFAKDMSFGDVCLALRKLLQYLQVR